LNWNTRQVLTDAVGVQLKKLNEMWWDDLINEYYELSALTEEILEIKRKRPIKSMMVSDSYDFVVYIGSYAQ